MSWFKYYWHLFKTWPDRWTIPSKSFTEMGEDD